MKQNKYTADQFVTAYRSWKNGDSPAKQAEISGIKKSSLHVLLHQLEQYINEGLPVKVSTSYKEAVRVLGGAYKSNPWLMINQLSPVRIIYKS